MIIDGYIFTIAKLMIICIYIVMLITPGNHKTIFIHYRSFTSDRA